MAYSLTMAILAMLGVRRGVDDYPFPSPAPQEKESMNIFGNKEQLLPKDLLLSAKKIENPSEEALRVVAEERKKKNSNVGTNRGFTSVGVTSFEINPSWTTTIASIDSTRVAQQRIGIQSKQTYTGGYNLSDLL